MRKFISLILAVSFLICCLSACSGKPADPVGPAEDDPSPEPFVPTELIMPEVNWNDSEDINATADVLQEYLTAYYNRLAKFPVRYTGDKSYKDGEYAVWVQELPEYQPYPNEKDADYSNVKAIFIYYPMDKDPSTLSDEQLKSEGAIRVFAYIGYPKEKAPGKYPGIVCVHGGGGQANPDYVIESVKHGFTAIAFDMYGNYIPVYGETASSDVLFEDTYPDCRKKDDFGHMTNTGFETIDAPLDEQWLYWTVGDCVLANSVLRAEEHTASDKVGITGISWGGLLTSTAACFDYRLSFAVPIYIAFHMAESKTDGLGLITNEKAAALWQDPDLLKKTPVPFLMLAGDTDGFSTVNCNSETYHDLQNGYLIIRPWFEHTQFDAIATDEPYRFGLFATGLGYGFVEAERQPAKEDGREYTLKINIPDDIFNVRADIFWREGPITDSEEGWNFKHRDLSFDKENNTVAVSVPENAYMYYISFRGYDSEIMRIKSDGTPFDYVRNVTVGMGTPSYWGSVFSSTDVVVLGNGNITE